MDLSCSSKCPTARRELPRGCSSASWLLHSAPGQSKEHNQEKERLQGWRGRAAAAARPTPVPQQPRPPRSPGVPSRASDQQRGKAQKSYSEAQGDQDQEDLLASDSEDDGSSQEPDESTANEGGPPEPRRSSRVPGGDASTVVFNQQTRAIVKEALWNTRATSDLEGAGLEVVTFMSATQLPRYRVNSVGVTGDADELDRRPESQGILISLKVRNFLGQVLKYSAALLWRWIAFSQGLDVTALLFRGEIIGATIGFYWTEAHVYLTHLTAVHRGLQGAGVGLFLRRWQIHQLNQRGPLEVVSLSESLIGAVQFQRRVLGSLGFDEVPMAETVIRRLAAAHPELDLERVLQQRVTPLRFRKITPLPGS